MCYGELMPYALLNSSVLRWLQKQDDNEDKSRLEWLFQTVGPQTAKLHDL